MKKAFIKSFLWVFAILAIFFFGRYQTLEASNLSDEHLHEVQCINKGGFNCREKADKAYEPTMRQLLFID